MSKLARGQNSIDSHANGKIQRRQRGVLLALLLLALFVVTPLALALNGKEPIPSLPSSTALAAAAPSSPLSNTVYIPLILNGNAPQQSEPDDEFEAKTEWYERFLMLHSDETGVPRPDLWQQGIAHVQQMPFVSRATRQAKRGAAAQVVGVQWSQIGPAPLRIDAEQNYQGAGPDSGQVVDIAIDPRNSTDQIVYIATNDGGIWKTTDGGVSWNPKTDYMPSLSMGAVALDFANKSIVYAGTGNPQDGAGRYCCFGSLNLKGVGIYKSIDGGETWTILGNSIFTGVKIHRIVSPAPNVLLVAASNGLYRSVDGGLNFGSNSPTFNNGTPFFNGSFISDLAIDTTNATTLYAAVQGQGVFRSTDSGATWPVSGNLFTASNGAPTANIGYIAFAQSTQPNNQTLYASVQDSRLQTTPPRPSPFPFLGLYQSTNGGGNWTRISSIDSSANGCQCGYDQTIAVDPQDAQRVYAAFQEMFLSTNGGGSFGNITNGKIHWDHHAVTFSPQTHWGGGGAPTHIWVGTDGGVASSANGGNNWANLNETIATNLLFSLDIGRGSSANRGYSFGGTQDTGTIQRQPGYAGKDWHLGVDGDGGLAVVDWSNPQRVYGTDNGQYMITTNGGGSWSFFTAAATGLPACSATNTKACGSPISLDQNDNKVVYVVNGLRLFRSTDSGATYTNIQTFTVGAVNPILGGGSIWSLALTKADSNVVWAGLADGVVWSTSNVSAGAGASWTQHIVTGAPIQSGATMPVTAIAIDPTDTNRVVVVYGGFINRSPANRTKHVFLTTNGGDTWTDISGTDGGDPLQNLPDLPLSAVAIDPSTIPHAVIVASDAGVFRTADNGATWQRFGLGLPNVLVSALAIDYSASPALLRAGTYGRSVFELAPASGPLLAVNTDLSFGGVPIGAAATRVVQVFNTGSADLHISSFARVAGSAAFQLISGPPTPVTIPAGHELDFTIRFLPTSAGPLTATFQINSDDPFAPAYPLSASGTGLAPKMVVVGDLNFGVVARGTAAMRNVTVYNTGGAPLTISSVAFLFGSDPSFLVVTPSTPQTIAPGSSLIFIVQFAPPANASSGTRTGTLQISGNDPVTPSVTLPATGQVGAPHLTVSSTELQFGAVPVDDRTNPHTNDQTLRLTNQSSCAGCDLQLLSLPIGGLEAGDFTLVAPPALPATIAAGNSLDLIVRFNPADDGGRSATLTVNSDDPTNPSVTVSLSGTGILPAITALPNPLIFGPTVYDPICDPLCGATLNQTVINSGQAELILDTLSISGSAMFTTPAALVPPLRVQPTDSANLPVTFHPTGGTARKVSGTLYITDTLGPAPTAAPVATAIPVCGEAVGRGIRVIVYDNNGNLVPVADRIKLQSHGLTQPVNEQVDNAPLTAIDPPTSCQRIQYHYENQNLQATEVAGNRGSYYILTVDVGNKHMTLSFTLEVNEFKTIIATVQ